MPRTRLTTLLSAGALLVCALTSPSASRASDDDNDDNGERSKKFSATLQGFNEVPAISSPGTGSFSARLSDDELSVQYKISFSGLSAPVTQSHIHFGRIHTAGAIMVWLCQSATNHDPTGLAPTCVNEGTVEGTITAANIVQAGAQGITAGEYAEFLAALRNRAGYANVHTTAFPGGEIRGDVH
jgi:hypothetical protein